MQKRVDAGETTISSVRVRSMKIRAAARVRKASVQIGKSIWLRGSLRSVEKSSARKTVNRIRSGSESPRAFFPLIISLACYLFNETCLVICISCNGTVHFLRWPTFKAVYNSSRILAFYEKSTRSKNCKIFVTRLRAFVRFWYKFKTDAYNEFSKHHLN